MWCIVFQVIPLEYVANLKIDVQPVRFKSSLLYESEGTMSSSKDIEAGNRENSGTALSCESYVAGKSVDPPVTECHAEKLSLTLSWRSLTGDFDENISHYLVYFWSENTSDWVCLGHTPTNFFTKTLTRAGNLHSSKIKFKIAPVLHTGIMVDNLLLFLHI